MKRALLAVLVTAAALLAAPFVAPAAAAAPAPTVTPSSTPALAKDAPDPDVVRVGSTFYAFTTGTTWGNQIGIAKTTSADPRSGWTTVGSAFPGTPWNGSAGVAPWQRNNTATSPGVMQIGGRWVMFYDAVDTASGISCLSVATASAVTGPYTDGSSGPLMCQTSLGGSIDPQPFLDPQTGTAYLIWKSNDGTTGNTSPSQVWSAPLTPDGLGLAATPTAIFTIRSATYSWQTTTDDPSMVYAGGSYYLFFSGGDYLSSNYPVGYVLCASGPRGGCDQNELADPILSTPGGSGGGMEFTDAPGNWWIAYQTWEPSGCTNYGNDCMRQLFVAPISLPPLTLSIATTALPKAPVGSPYDQTMTATGGSTPYTWAVTGGSLPSGLTLSTSGAVTGTPTTTGAQNVTVQVTDSSGLSASQSMSVAVVQPTAFSPLSPVRVCDTRPGNPSNLSGQAAANCSAGGAGSTLGAGGSVTIAVAGVAAFGVPADATAVVLNVTAVAPTGPGFLTVYPAGATRPFASTVNLVPGADTPNLVTVGTGAGGAETVFSSTPTDMVVDVLGYTDATAADGPGSGLYEPLPTPVRVCDTRPGNPSGLTGAAAACDGPGNAGSTLPAGGTQTVSVAGAFGVPSGATAAVLDVTAVNPAATGFLTVFPHGTPRPFASNVNYAAGQTVANRVLVPLSGGAVSVYSLQRADVVVDLAGYYTASGTTPGAAFSAEPAPVRVCDTRAGNPSGLTGPDAQCTGKILGPGQALTVSVRGLAGVPAGATAVVANLTAVAPTATTFLTVYPGGARPVVSDLNPAPGQDRANLVVATVGSGGTVTIYNNAGSTDVVVDVEGWYA